MENALRAKPERVREQLKDLQEAYGEAMLELRARIEPTPPTPQSCASGNPTRLAE